MEYTPSFRDQLQNGSEPSWRDDLSDELYHHGIKGMHWGVRRPRNEDGIIQGAGKGLFQKMKARRQRNKEAKQDYKAAKAKAKKDLQDWGNKANARYAKDKKYRESGQLGPDSEKAINRYNAAKKAAKSRYKQTVNAEKIERLKKRRNIYGAYAGANRSARKSRSKQKTALGKAIVTIATPGLAVNEKYYSHRQKAMNRKINRLSN